MLKWVLRRTTGKCELERICSGYPSGAERTKAVENCLKHSRIVALKKIVTAENLNAAEAVNNIIALKSVDINRNQSFRPALLQCLQQIGGYQKLVNQVRSLQKEKYSATEEDHEKQLMKLWNLMKPETTLERRKTKQWGQLGFQGDDPATDFRGMGILGLQNLIFFAENYNSIASKVLSQSLHPKFGYSYAVVGINLTSLIFDLLCKKYLKYHFYNTVSGEPALYHFHRVYCYVFCEFNNFWLTEEPESIMEFSRILDKYREKLIERLREPQASLQNNLLGE